MILKADKLIKRYGQFTALDNVSFQVEKGDIFGFLGPNGAGKTTTIRILSSVLKPDSGSVEIDGHDVSKEPDYIKSIINSLPESFSCYDWMSATEYLEFFAKLYHSHPDIKELLKSVGLDPLSRKPTGTYSRGMKQRLGIARSLINSPQLILLDEPTSGLDPIGRREIHDLLININKTKNTTILLSTHLLDDVDRLCNRIALIDNGRIVREGHLEELKKSDIQTYLIKTKTNPKHFLQPPNIKISVADQGYLAQLDSGITLNYILSELIKNKIEILEVIEQKKSLEELFFKFTGNNRELL
ncbi:MAG: ABC transporter ATP-binding protein [Sedimentisphaerales bacterium]